MMEPINQEQIDTIRSQFPDLVRLKDRNPKLSTLGSPAANFEKWYGLLVNDWIVQQPDSGDLMRLFIVVGFNATAFVQVLK